MPRKTGLTLVPQPPPAPAQAAATPPVPVQDWAAECATTIVEELWGPLHNSVEAEIIANLIRLHCSLAIQQGRLRPAVPEEE